MGTFELMASEIVAVLRKERLCLPCLARAARQHRDEVARSLNEAAATLDLSQQTALCGGCGAVRMTYKI
jgi:hypothetical protein